ncbi:MAG TPA: ATP-dependent DNA helicase [Planctomycetaceae bacterium]|nr:ATP-dependent DNA helicase [Planctomycetaceae bacterium]
MNQESASIETVLGELNPPQRQAACHGDSPLLIVAGAGTGKTTTLAHRVAWLIHEGTDASRILLLTFTRRASAEMLRRVEAILRQLDSGRGGGAAGSTRVWGGTFHSIATRLLRRFGRLIELPTEFSILDRGDSEDLMASLRNELGLGETGRRFPKKGTCAAIYSRVVNTQTTLAEVLETAFPWCAEDLDGLGELFAAYVDRKEVQHCLDFDDLLVFWEALLDDPTAGPAIRKLFDCVLVDEYQDTNRLQGRLLKGLCPGGTGLTAVGDDAQSIYSFRAATIRNILDFPEEYPDTTVVPLEQNYRSTQPILEMTNRVIAQASQRHSKTLWSDRTSGEHPVLVDCTDEDEQSEFVVDQILARREEGVALKDQAVLFRASHHSLALEVELAQRNVPFHKYGGLRFLETAHIKDLLAFLKLVDNPRDGVAANRLLLLLPGIGPVRAGRLVELLLESGGQISAWDEIKPPPAAEEIWPDLLRLLKRLAGDNRSEQNVSAELHQVRKFYTPLLETRYDHASARVRDLEQLEQLATRYNDRSRFLAEITLDPPSSTQDFAGEPILDDDFLVLSTIHSSKGLEWDSVFVIHVADGNIPSDMATGNADEIDEERRLLYVAMTRAKNRLFACYPQRYYFRGRRRSDAHGFSQLSRFFTDEVIACCDRRPARQLGDEDSMDEDFSADVTAAEIRRRIKDLW